MAQEFETAESGTEKATTNTPVWDSYSGEMYPFLNLDEKIKRAGFRVRFLSDKPRKETPNNFDQAETDFWFDVEQDGQVYTWTFSQKSLLMELQKHRPLTGKAFEIQLVPVDDAFKKAFPKYKGKDRYRVTPVPSNPAPTSATSTSGKTNSPKKTATEALSVTEETVED